MEDVASQIHVKGVRAIAAVNWTASAILVFSTPPKLYVVVPKNRFQSHGAFYRLEIYPVDH